ncbi:MAG: class I adenylate-forming enzyme family protein [Parasphingorhabdus sp.]|uniref:class I adenylate-forming enzyme family protein n=1 Tax=Parasphingorhabdus sp. TaxID=2709688 RepID=UPI0030028341
MQTSLLLEMAADGMADRVAIGGADGNLSYAELAEQARGGAAFLVEQTGTKTVFIGLNGAAMPVALFASGIAGKPFTPLNYRLADADLQRLLERTAPAIAIVDADMMPRVAGTEGIIFIDSEDFLSVCREKAAAGAEVPFTDEEIAVLLFTSGTTGDPKAAVLRHTNLTSYVISSVEFMGAGEDEAALVSVPPYHIAGISAVLTGVYSGRRIVYLPNFTPEAWVDAAASEKISHAMVVPTMLGRVLDLIEQRGEDLPHLRALSYGGGRMPQSVIERALHLLPHVNFVNAYGLTETSSTIAVLGPDDHRTAHLSDDPAVKQRLGSVGQALPAVELEVRKPDGTRCPPHHTGEVHVRGDQIAGEYMGQSMLDANGWFPTKDSGFLDEEGYLFIDGRLDDVIVRGGENISPGEIEDILRTHPGVRDVAVLGLPDVQWGEKVAAVIVPSDPAPSIVELADWVKTRLRSTKTPEMWDFRSELPYNETGKLLRRVLKAELTENGTA